MTYMYIKITKIMQLCAGERGENSLHPPLSQFTGFVVSALREQQPWHYGQFKYMYWNWSFKQNCG